MGASPEGVSPESASTSFGVLPKAWDHDRDDPTAFQVGHGTGDAQTMTRMGIRRSGGAEIR